MSPSPTSLPAPRPGYVRGPGNTQRELVVKPNLREPGTASAAVHHSLRLGRGETSRCFSPHALPFGGWGRTLAPGPPRQLSGWTGISHHRVGPQQGTKVSKTAEPGCKARAPTPREESSGLGQGCNRKGLEGHSDQHKCTYLSTHGCRPVFCQAHNPWTHSSVLT